jgi:hypothetical protein
MKEGIMMDGAVTTIIRDGLMHEGTTAITIATITIGVNKRIDLMGVKFYNGVRRQ